MSFDISNGVVHHLEPRTILRYSWLSLIYSVRNEYFCCTWVFLQMQIAIRWNVHTIDVLTGEWMVCKELGRVALCVLECSSDHRSVMLPRKLDSSYKPTCNKVSKVCALTIRLLRNTGCVHTDSSGVGLFKLTQNWVEIIDYRKAWLVNISPEHTSYRSVGLICSGWNALLQQLTLTRKNAKNMWMPTHGSINQRLA